MRRWLWLIAFVGCSSPQPAPVAQSKGAFPIEDLAVDAGARPKSNACPDDAPWNGKVCSGAGYTACPGDMRLEGDAGDMCILHETPTPAKSAEPRPARVATTARPVDSGEPEGDSTGVPECDRFLRVYERCLAKNQGPKQAQAAADSVRTSYRRLARDPKMRQTLSQQCTTTMRTLRSTCP